MSENVKQVRIVHPHQRDTSTAQTAGMVREAGVAASTVGAFVILRGAGRSATAAGSPKDLAARSANGGMHGEVSDSKVLRVGGSMVLGPRF